MKILVVDDLAVDRYIIKRTLQPEFEVITLSSAAEAMAFSRSHTFDIALINVMLRNDLDCIPLLKELEQINTTPFAAIAITSYIDESRMIKLLAAGFKNVLFKPFDKASFTLAIRSIDPNRLRYKYDTYLI
jgi:CheY-like chemotaxis protein